jgi:hypothetical protein
MEELKHQARQAEIEKLRKQFVQPADKNNVRRGSLCMSLTQNNFSMKKEVAMCRKNMTINGRANLNDIQKAPALDPNKSMRRLSITANNLNSYNSLYVLGSIHKT